MGSGFFRSSLYLQKTTQSGNQPRLINGILSIEHLSLEVGICQLCFLKFISSKHSYYRRAMGVRETKCSSGYGKPPWIFKGSALYQLHLVKAETARASIPKEFRLVEAFGYTLGGFFLASYDDSPAGVFDELVVIAGLVWNRPTSCAWAAKVLVNSNEACDHGRKEVGLPSQVASFSKRITAITRQPKNKDIGFLNAIGMGATLYRPRDHMNVQVTEIKGLDTKDTCNINLATVVPALSYKWMGPAIKLSLPSYSGRTEHNPNLLKYSCQIECRVRAVQPVEVSGPTPIPCSDREHYSQKLRCVTMDSTTKEHIDNGENISIAVMLSKPILALELSCLKMQVEAPTVVSPCSRNS